MKRMTSTEISRIFSWTGNLKEVDNGWTFSGKLEMKDHRQKRIPINIVSVGGSIDLNPRSMPDCNLETLEGLPQAIPGGLKVDYAKITSLKGCPQDTITGTLNLRNCLKLNNLDDLPTSVGSILMTWNPDLPVLRIIQQHQVINWDTKGMPASFANIWYKYKGKGQAAVWPVAAELIKAGLRNNAHL